MDEQPRKMKNYRPRIVDGVLKQRLRMIGGVLVEGPKWCGKTTSAEMVAGSVLRLGKAAVLERAKLMAAGDLTSLLRGAAPRLIDEWQTMPKLWDEARSEIDERGKFGQFIFTGSAVPLKAEERGFVHTGTGRFARVKMRTMSLYESGESNGAVSLGRDLFGRKKVFAETEMTMNDLAFALCRGGFPQSLAIRGKADAMLVAQEYFKSVVELDISRVDEVRRDADYARRFMRSYARLQGEQAPLTTVQSDVAGVIGRTPSINTIVSYYEALKDIFVIDDMGAWNPNLRSKTAIRVTDTRYFVDPAIAVASLDADIDGLLGDLNTMGFVFETLCMRDLRVYAEALGGGVAHYRDSNGLECDAVVHIPGGKYGLVQVKLGGTGDEVDDAAEKMRSLARIIDTDEMREPEFMMVLTGVNKTAYRRDDGVYVVPVGCLKP